MLGDWFEQDGRNDFYKGQHYGGRRQFLISRGAQSSKQKAIAKTPTQRGSLATIDFARNPPAYLQVFLPPEEFRTRKQARRIAKLSQDPLMITATKQLSKPGSEPPQNFLTFDFSTLQKKHRKFEEDEEDEEDEELEEEKMRTGRPSIDSKEVTAKIKSNLTVPDRVLKAGAKKIKKINIRHFLSTDPGDWDETSRAGVRCWIHKKSKDVSIVCPWSQVHTDRKPKKKSSLIALRRSFAQENSPLPSLGSNSGEVTPTPRGGAPSPKAAAGNNEIAGERVLCRIGSMSMDDHESAGAAIGQIILLPPLPRPSAKDAESSRPNTGMVRALGEGTGSLAYDSSEVNDLFNILDDMRKTDNASPGKSKSEKNNNNKRK